MKKKENKIFNTFRLGLLTLAISVFCLINIKQSAKNIVYRDQFSSPAQNLSKNHNISSKGKMIFPEAVSVSKASKPIKKPAIQADFIQKGVTKKLEVIKIQPEIIVKQPIKKIKKPILKSRSIASLRPSTAKKDFTFKNNDLRIKLFDKGQGKAKEIVLSYRILASSQQSIDQYEESIHEISSYISNQKAIRVDSIFVSSDEKNKIEKNLLSSINKFLPNHKIDRVLISKFLR